MKRIIKEIIIHCSATQEDKDYTVADIDRWHRARGFKKIGYHFVIYRNGDIHVGRSLSEIGAHCKGAQCYQHRHLLHRRLIQGWQAEGHPNPRTEGCPAGSHHSAEGGIPRSHYPRPQRVFRQGLSLL